MTAGATDCIVERKCLHCGIDISEKIARAKYCSKYHKQLAANKRHRERNPGYFKRYDGRRKKDRESNKVEYNRKAREYQRSRFNDPEIGPKLRAKSAEWWAANPEKHRLYQANRRSRKINNPGSVGVSERDWLRLVNRYRGCCAYCGDESDSIELDHVIPLVKGGRHAIGNVLPACTPCNRSKNARWLADWRFRR